MKKNVLVILLSMFGATALFMTGCSKDDTTPPTITITGSTSEEVSLGATWADQGATANDDEDGALTATSDASATNPNVNKVGTYTITYTATDAAGNVGSAIRTVRVKNDAEDFARNYSVNDVVPGAPGSPFIYNQTVTVDQTINNRIHFSRFADYTNNTDIYADRDPVSGELSIPLQSSGHDIGSNNGGSCDVVKHYFYTTNFSDLTSGFIIEYVDSIGGNNNSCDGSSSSGTAQYSF